MATRLSDQVTSTLSAAELLELEYICEEFIVGGDFSVGAVRRFAQPAHGKRWQQTLLLELLAAVFCDAVQRADAARPLARELQPTLGDLIQDLGQVALTEFETRYACGQDPDVAQFLEWYADLAGMQGRLFEEIDRIQPLDVVIHVDGHLLLAIPFSEPLLLGRKHADDPEVPAVVDMGDDRAKRVVISKQKYFSRDHTELRRTSVKGIKITNLATKLPLLVNEKHEVAPGGVYEVCDVCEITLHDVSVKIESRALKGS